MICCLRFLLHWFIVVFAAGVICSVICPERPILPAGNHQENGPCTDCTSTDFIGGAKVSVAKVSPNATAGVDLDSFAASSSPFVSFSVAVSTNILLESSPPLSVTNRILRV